MKKILAVWVVLVGCVAWGRNLFPNGELVPDEKGGVKGWNRIPGLVLKTDADGQRTVTFTKGETGQSFMIPLRPEWGVLTLKTKMKTQDLVIGKEGWMTGRIPMSFHGADGKMVGGWPSVFGFVGTRDWTDCTRDYLIPKGATKLNISLVHYGKSGSVSFAPVSLTVKRNRTTGPCNAPLPDGVSGDPWSLDDAWRQVTAARTRYSLNGLWGLRPVLTNEETCVDFVPGADDNWGWGRIPSVIGSPWGNRHGRVQTVWHSPWFDDEKQEVNFDHTAWYRRDFVMPQAAEGKRVALTFTMLNTRAVVFVDGRRAGEVTFPGGEADITKFVKPGEKQSLVMLVTAYPLNAETLDFNAPDRAQKRKAMVKLRGVTGDLYLDIFPKTARITDAVCETSTQDGVITFVAETENLSAAAYRLEAVVKDAGGRQVRKFTATDLTPDAAGALRLRGVWQDALRWDTHTPQNLYTCELSLFTADGKLVDAAVPFRFGFRDVVIKGRDLLLNGTPIHLRALHNDTMNVGADKACKAAALELCRRHLKNGYNFMIAGNYNFSPGQVAYMDALLEACDETGMLFSFSLPHIRDFGMRLDKPAAAARYRALTKWAIARARRHPSVITYAMNHNTTGYAGDMNPLRIDGKYVYENENRRQAQIAYRIARALDATRPIYHHESGNLDDFHTINIYLNWAPVQERSDWLEHWAKEGVKPLFFVEWGMPHVASWSSYRGPLFIWTRDAYQSLWASEFAATFRGDAAYEGDTPAVRQALAREERFWAKGEPFEFGRMIESLRAISNNYHGVQAHYMKDNWRSHRGWGITIMLPWDQGEFDREKATEVANPAAFTNLKQPGIVPDIRTEHTRTATQIGAVMERWNQFDCAFIGGEKVFTDKRHLYRAGEAVKKTLVILNDRRTAQQVKWTCALKAADGKVVGERQGVVTVAAGTRMDVPVALQLPAQAGTFTLAAEFTFEGNAKQTDVFAVEALPPLKVQQAGGLLLYDPKGLTTKEFGRLGIKYTKTDLKAPPEKNAKLVIGRESLTLDVYNNVVFKLLSQENNNVLIFEQTKEMLEAIGFRVQHHGLRNMFVRFRHHHFKEFTEERIRDWAGESTLLPPYLPNIRAVETQYPTEKWAGMNATRVWRCRNRGMVAGVIFEKPSAGNWRSLFDGGFDLQYTALAEHVSNYSRVTYCQMDVTARTEVEPAADDLICKLVSRLNQGDGWKKWVKTYGMKAYHMARHYSLGMTPDPQQEGSGWFLVSSGAKRPDDFLAKIEKGGKALCLGLTAQEVNAWSPVPLRMVETNNCHYSRVEKFPAELNGLSNADWAWHGAMDFTAFVDPAPDGNTALRIVRHGKGAIVFWQVPPWKIDADAKPYLRGPKRKANALFARLCSNLGIVSFARSVRYFDTPVEEDDPYRYFRW